ncbi:MAG: DUF192 domain-containing protein [archaeon]
MYLIKNITKKTEICKRKNNFTSILSKAVGLMFSKKIEDVGYIFIFSEPRKIDLHMFFVFFPIDVIFLDENKKVIELKENFQPFTIHYSKHNSKYVIELSAGTIHRSKTTIGDILSF